MANFEMTKYIHFQMWKNWRKLPFLLPLTKYLSFLQSQWITKIFHIWKLISFAFLIFAITEKMTSGYRWHRACSFRGHLTMRTSDTRTYTKSVSYIVSRPGKGYVRAWVFWEKTHPSCLKSPLDEGILKGSIARKRGRQKFYSNNLVFFSYADLDIPTL